MKIPFARPSITSRERRAVDRVLKKGWLTLGQETLKFEQDFAKFIGAPFCVAVSSCTAGLFLAAEMIKVFKSKPKLVTLPSLTFSATAATLLQAGIKITFEDIEPETLVMKRTNKLSVPVHYAGLFNKQPRVLFEDSAHRILPKSFTGNISCFSFYATKNLTTGEGGMVALSSKRQAEWLKKARLHGMTKDSWKRYQIPAGMPYQIEFTGWKANLTDLAAAIGREQLKRLKKMNQKRKQIGQRYNKLLGIKVDREAYHLYPILVNRRAQFSQYMASKGVATSIHFPPLHQQPAYQQIKHKPLPVTEYVARKIVSLPLFVDMTIAQVDYVASLVIGWWDKYGKPNWSP